MRAPPPLSTGASPVRWEKTTQKQGPERERLKIKLQQSIFQKIKANKPALKTASTSLDFQNLSQNERKHEKSQTIRTLVPT